MTGILHLNNKFKQKEEAGYPWSCSVHWFRVKYAFRRFIILRWYFCEVGQTPTKDTLSSLYLVNTGIYSQNNPSLWHIMQKKKDIKLTVRKCIPGMRIKCCLSIWRGFEEEKTAGDASSNLTMSINMYSYSDGHIARMTCKLLLQV